MSISQRVNINWEHLQSENICSYESNIIHPSEDLDIRMMPPCVWSMLVEVYILDPNTEIWKNETRNTCFQWCGLRVSIYYRYICCKPFPWLARITLSVWRFFALCVIRLDIPITWVFRISRGSANAISVICPGPYAVGVIPNIHNFANSVMTLSGALLRFPRAWCR